MRFYKHHIVPKHAGGTDDLNNIVKVNLAMHAFLHKQLYEEYGRWQDEIAYRCLSGAISMQEAIKQSQIKANLGNKNRKGPKPKEECDKISRTLKGRQKPEGFGEKMSKALTGHKQSPEHLANKLANRPKTYKKRIR